ncbi:MAG: ABC transporter permease [Chitinophagaceae bacterium]
MQAKYSQIQAMLAISKASLKSILRSPSTVIFSIAFPLIFILVFGLIGGSSGVSLNVVFSAKSDTLNPIYPILKSIPNLKIKNKSGAALKEDLEKGRIVAEITIVKTANAAVPYSIQLKSSEAVSPQNIQVLKSIINSIVSGINKVQYPTNKTIAQVEENVQKIPGRVYRTIDFILPGQLGFSLLSAGVFGVAFLFFNLRQQLVLKRFFATPIKRSYIVLGEAISRVIFQLITAIIIIGIGHYAFNYTLVNGIYTFIDIMILSFIALLVFMGFGFIVSSLAKNESTIPPFANLFTLPQFLLAGTFFSIDNFPTWLQPICRILPLTHFNTAMRNIAFEGASLMSCWREIGVLGIWGIIIYAVAVKTFKWD